MTVLTCTRAGLEEMQRQHRHLLVLTVRPAQFALPAVVQGGVGAVPALHDLHAFVDLTTELGLVSSNGTENRV
jgi:hypothetical protein